MYLEGTPFQVSFGTAWVSTRAIFVKMAFDNNQVQRARGTMFEVLAFDIKTITCDGKLFLAAPRLTFSTFHEGRHQVTCGSKNVKPW